MASVGSCIHKQIALKSRFLLYKSSILPIIELSGGRYYQNNEKEESYYQTKKNNRAYGFLSVVTAFFGSYAAKYLFSNERECKKFSLLTEAYAATNNVNLRQRFNFISDVVESAAPSVVYIEVKSRQDDWITLNSRAGSNGSGFIVDPNGLILTNAHVINQRKGCTVIVKLNDGREFEGTLENIDVRSDLATIRINAKNLPVMKLGSSSNLRPGEWVVAIGSPLSLSNTVTAGIVSAAQRPGADIGIQHNDINYIQTDASITFGNSGGPLVNLDGEAIGINSLKITPGISFAIPIDYAKEFLSRKKSDQDYVAKKRQRRIIGMAMVTLKDSHLRELHSNGKLPENVKRGVLVWRILIGGASHEAGLRPGDVITQINEKKIQSVQDIFDFLESDDILTIYIVRDCVELKLILRPREQ